MFDSPFAYCASCGEMVLLDQTRRECCAEHACGDCPCPLAHCFTGRDFSAPREDVQPAEERQERRPRRRA